MAAMFSQLTLHPPNRSATSLYTSSLAQVPSPWIPKLGIVATLGNDEDEGSVGGSHSVVVNRVGHSGCVNAAAWSPYGDAIVTAGDDTKLEHPSFVGGIAAARSPQFERRICIWSSQRERASADTSDGVDYALTDSIDSGHTRNIFSVKFAPQMPSRLFSAAGDGEVRVFDLNNSTSGSTVRSNGRTWTHHDRTACTHVFTCHSGRVKRIATENSPDVFLTCSEDGTVRQHDLRVPHSCAREECGPPLVSYPGLSLYSLSISKARPYLFVVAGTSPYAFLHDRRMMRAEMSRDWGIDMKEGETTQCVRRFGVPKPDGDGEIDEHIVSCKLSESNPQDLIVSYSGNPVYLFDIFASPGTPPRVKRSHSPSTDEPHSPPSPPSASAEPSSDTKRPRHDSEGENTTPVQAQEARGESAIEENEEVHVEGDGDDDKDEDEDGDESAEEGPEEDYYGANQSRQRWAVSVPITYPRQQYTGHANQKTVKDVNFAFAGSHVISGSDDGNFFIWEKESGKLVGVFKGDSQVVNVMQPHPRLPILLISGIDTTVKIFGPTEPPSNLIADAESITSLNRRARRTALPELGVRLVLVHFYATGESADYFFFFDTTTQTRELVALLHHLRGGQTPVGIRVIGAQGEEEDVPCGIQ